VVYEHRKAAQLIAARLTSALNCPVRLFDSENARRRKQLASRVETVGWAAICLSMWESRRRDRFVLGFQGS
jgi:hypothetical protein